MKSIDRHRPRLGVASGRLLAFPSGIAREGLGRQLRLGEPELGQQQIPEWLLVPHEQTRTVSYLPMLGFQQAYVPTKGRASRSYNWTWQRYHSTEGSSFGGR